jgi:hypothetical protein
MKCPHAKSDMTPCYLKDGKMCLVEIWHRPHCVGCERSQRKLDIEKRKEKKTDKGDVP